MTDATVPRRKDDRLLEGLLALWVFCLVLGLLPFTEDPAGPVKELLCGWLLVPLFVLLALRPGARQQDSALWANPGLLLLGAFLGMNLLAAIISDFPARSVYELRHWAGFALAALAAAEVIRTPAAAWRLLLTIIAAVACSSVYGLLQHAGWDPFPWAMRDVEEYRALPSTYANPNLAGHALVMAIVLALGCLIRFRKRPALAFPIVCFLALTGAHLHLTHMRAGPIALAAAGAFALAWLLLLPVFRKPGRVFAVLTSAAIAAGAGGAVWLAQGPLFQEGGPLPVDSSMVLRVNGYHGAARMIQDAPALGVGPGNYELENARYWTPFEKEWFATKRKKNAHVHCEPLELAVDAGLPGVGLFFALLAWGMLTSLGMARREATPGLRVLGLSLAACFVAFTVDGLFGFNLHAPVSGGLFFLLLGVVAGVATRDGRVATARGRAGLVLASLLIAVAHTWSYAAEFALQRGAVARAYGEAQAEDGDAGGAAYARKKARESLAWARTLLPWDHRPTAALADLAMIEERWDEAAALYANALDAAPNSPVLWAGQAGAFLQDGNLARAEASAKRALDLCAPWAEANAVLGETRLIQADKDGHGAGEAWLYESVEYLSRAAVWDPADFGRVQWLLGRVHTALGNHATAGHAFERAVEADPTAAEYWDAFAALARARQTTGYHDALHAALAHGRQSEPPDRSQIEMLATRLRDEVLLHGYDARLAAAALFLTLDEAAESETLWRAYASVLPEEEQVAGIQLGLAQCSEDDDETDAPFLRALFGDDEANRRAGFLELAARVERDEDGAASVGWVVPIAERYMRDAPLPASMRPEANAALGRVRIAQGLLAEGVELLAQATPQLEGRPRCDAFLAWSRALEKRGDPAGALDKVREAALVGGGRVDVRWCLARLLAENGRTAEARMEYLSLLRRITEEDSRRATIEAEYNKIGEGKSP